MKSVTVNETITSNFKYRKTIQISAQRKIDKFGDYKGQVVEIYKCQRSGDTEGKYLKCMIIFLAEIIFLEEKSLVSTQNHAYKLSF